MNAKDGNRAPNRSIPGNPIWPSLRSYDRRHLDRISLPIGGIGTGTIGLGGRGDLRDFEVGNRPAKGFRPSYAFLAIRIEREGFPTVGRVLEGPLGDGEFEGMEGSPASNHGLPRFSSARFEAAYPFGQVHLEDAALPAVTLGGFNPLVPGDLEASSWPLAAIRVTVTNTFDTAIVASVASVIENFVGANGTDSSVGANRNEVRRGNGIIGVSMTAPELDPRSEAGGEFVMAMVHAEGSATSIRTSWADGSWGNPLLDFWDDFIADGALHERESRAQRPIASLASSTTINAGESHAFTVLLTWSFPNRRAWNSESVLFDETDYTDEIVGNHYSIAYPDPWQTALDAVDALPKLEAETVAAISSIVDSSTPIAIREAALFNLSTLRSPTVFRTSDGRFYAWEGVMDKVGSCFGTCNHVWAYEFATSYWFADLAWSFRETQYELATHDNGLMSFRVGLPISESQKWETAAADGQMATLVHLYHDWTLSGDNSRLARLWPAARKSLEFAWIPGGWDADQDGVMEGCQHNTMDVEYFGPNPQMGTWYLAALRACTEMARAMGDDEFADKCHNLFVSGSKWIDDSLFTGSYYRHEIRPVGPDGFIANGLRHATMGSRSLEDPDLQLGDGVLVDQLVGQYASRLAGLGGVLDSDHVATTLNTIFERNFRRDFHDHFNHMRSFVLGDESGLLMCTYEEGKRPSRPFPYFSEVMTGFEYTAAVGMIQDGNREDAVTVIDAIRSRYNGLRRNPFNEAECGHHYSRAMASWSAFVAWNGFEYNGRSRTFTIDLAAPEGGTFWSTGSAWGTWSQGARGDVVTGELTVKGGSIAIEAIIVSGTKLLIDGDVVKRAGTTVRVRSEYGVLSSSLAPQDAKV
ncbi:GH116 family glycosyl-hydrolase [Diaminobutyricibacter sp. McL0608]|uniref:GH116 family glycosyl-hydrolase n=1 Tax=Leifsonia sp. McL0608 TaxID=3143537 RepID=UPI0031F32DAE